MKPFFCTAARLERGPLRWFVLRCLLLAHAVLAAGCGGGGGGDDDPPSPEDGNNRVPVSCKVDRRVCI